MKKSGLFKLGWYDLINGIVMAFLVAAGNSIYQVFNSGTYPTKAQLWISFQFGVGAAIMYVLKNLTQNENGKFFSTGDTPPVPPPKP